MQFNSAYNFGDVVFAATGGGAIGPLTIGKIRVEQTDSPGIAGETLFDNYKPQEAYEEGYMCVETGIGSGNVYRPENLFSTKEQAELRVTEVHAAKEKEEVTA